MYNCDDVAHDVAEFYAPAALQLDGLQYGATGSETPNL